MRRITLVLGVLILLSACQDSASLVEPPPDALLQRAAEGNTIQVIVQVRNQADVQPMAAQARAEGARVRVAFHRFPLLSLEVNENALRGLQRSPRVVRITENRAVPPALDNSLPVINADQVHALGWTGSGLAVAILDTGIDREHPFFGNRVVEEACFSNPGGTTRTSLCPDGTAAQSGTGSASINITPCQTNGGNRCDHGPHVAGIAAGDGSDNISAPTAGVAPGADIIAIQVFTLVDDEDACGNRPAPCVLAYTDDMIQGLQRVLELSSTYTIASANMSLGGGEFSSACDDEAIKLAIDDLVDANIATAIASGNDGFPAAVGFPACVSTAITVGATTNTDAVTRNRGVLLDLFAPGEGIRSATFNNNYGPKSGTSMAAPHVAGAWAVLREAFPTMTVAEVLARLQDTGEPITYLSGGANVTTPRIDLLAAIQASFSPPAVTVDNATVTVDEGAVATNTGTMSDPAGGTVTLSASVGTVVDNGDGTWAWSFQTTDGPAESQTVTITGTNEVLLEGAVTFELEVENVAPTVTIDPAQVTVIDEGTTLTVRALFSDPGVQDRPFSVSVQCYDIPDFGERTVGGTVQITSNSPILEGTVTAQCPYGDTSQSGEPATGTFTVTVTVTDKDGDSGTADFKLTVKNVDPTVEINTSGAEDIGGAPTFIAQIGVPLDFSARVTDPGSDDLELTWDWDDGNTTVATYLVDPPNLDPFPSPNVDPRDVTDHQTHTWTGACLFDLTLTAVDDDGGSATDGAAIIIAGTSGRARTVGYWLPQYRGNRSNHFDTATLDCYLAIAGHMSAVFDEIRDGTSSRSAAAGVLHVGGNSGSSAEILDRQLLAAWLNFANGAFGWSDLVDTTGDGIGDTPFSAAVTTAEAVRVSPASTDAELETQKDILERINLMHGG